MSAAAWGVIGAVALPLVGVLVLWLRRKLNLSDDAAVAVASGGAIKPASVDEALIALARRLDDQGRELDSLRIYLPQVTAWGHRGWAYAPADRREPVPSPPGGTYI